MDDSPKDRALAADDLSTPLGQDKKKRRFRIPAATPYAVAGVLALPLLVFVGWTLKSDDPLGGEPMAMVAATDLRPMPKVALEEPTPGNPAGPRRFDGPEGGAPAAPGSRTINVIDGSTGKREVVTIPAGGDAGPAAAAPVGDHRVTESSRHGTIPRVGADGIRPVDVYARPLQLTGTKAELPRIAIVVTGLGIGSTGTQAALAKLPGAVTLAFAPYGTDLERVIGKARNDGHEVLLQIPMEPFDYPDNDPGPRTLLTSLAAEQNIDRLHWLMSRFQGYVGLSNYMGARFTATEPALGPVLREAAKRGLLYLDDGSSPRSLASQVAGAASLPFAKAEVSIDAVPTPTEIDRALSRLEAMARERGSAVGVASALPVAIERLVRWSKTLESRGFVLVPISAIATKAKQQT